MALTDDILAYWNLNNNGSGGVSLVDSTGNGNTLTNSGTTLGSGIIAGGANAGLADGQLSHSSIITDPCSISFWFKADGTASTDGAIIIFSDMGYGFQGALQNGTYGTDGSVDFVMWQGDGSNIVISSLASTYGDNSWHHFVATIDGTNANFYLDGVLQGTSTYSGHSTPWDPSFPFQFPGYSSDSWLPTGNYLTDEVGVWNQALSQADVTELYNGGAGLTYPFANAFFNAAVDGSLSTLGNWWQDFGFTTPAVSLPTSTDVVVISSAVTSGTATYGSAYITANIGSAVTITAITILTNATNSGTLVGNCNLNGTSSNAGTITGNATVYNPAQNPLGGTVTGTITYEWPNGTGLWGNEVWIDGSPSFIIPIESDVRSGVEYGPANTPYIGTYSGGGGSGGIDLARLIKLPAFIKL
jgi:hypothetical protein